MHEYLRDRVGFCHITKNLGASTPLTPSVPPPRIGDHFYFKAAEDQGQNPYCVAYGVCHVMQAAFWRAFGYPIQFDEVTLYEDCKKVDGTPNTPGTQISVAIQLISTQCEKYMAEPHKLASLTWKYDGDIIRTIHRYGAAIVAFRTDDGWVSPRPADGLITLQGNPGGGHCQVADAYDLTCDHGGRIFLPNWWGKTWGCQTPGFEGRCSLRIDDLPNVMYEVHGIEPMWEDQPE